MDKYDWGKKLWGELWKRAKDGYYKDKPFQFSKDEVYIRYLLGLIDERRYQVEKVKLEHLTYQYHCHDKDKNLRKCTPYLIVL